MNRIAVVGAGAFGTALAVTWARAGRAVTLWGRDAEAMDRAARARAVPRLPGVALPDALVATGDAEAVRGADAVVLAVPTQTLPAVASAFADRIGDAAAVAACKGLDLTTLEGPAATLARVGLRAAILSGPSFAADIARGLPTALTLAPDDAGLQALLSTPTLRVYRADDVRGVELGGALKNVVALACGAAIGAGLGESARAALMTRGMAEMQRLAATLGAEPRTLAGLSGLGDLALTCASPQSRNFAAGLALGGGAPLPDATTEGVHTARAALDLGARHGLDLPVTAAVVALLDGSCDVGEAVDALLSRDLTTE